MHNSNQIRNAAAWQEGRRAGRARLPVRGPHGWPWPRFSEPEAAPVERGWCGRGDVAEEGLRGLDKTAPPAVVKSSPQQGEKRKKALTKAAETLGIVQAALKKSSRVWRGLGNVDFPVSQEVKEHPQTRMQGLSTSTTKH